MSPPCHFSNKVYEIDLIMTLSQVIVVLRVSIRFVILARMRRWFESDRRLYFLRQKIRLLIFASGTQLRSFRWHQHVVRRVAAGRVRSGGVSTKAGAARRDGRREQQRGRVRRRQFRKWNDAI